MEQEEKEKIKEELNWQWYFKYIGNIITLKLLSVTIRK